jgi:hypothetical protein
MDTKGEYSAGEGVVTQAELAGFNPETFNTGLSYTYRSLDVQVKLIHRGEVLGTFNADPAARLYRFSRTNVNLNLKYNWKPWLGFYVDVINVFDASLQNNYMYIRDRVRQTQVFTPAIKAGFVGRF